MSKINVGGQEFVDPRPFLEVEEVSGVSNEYHTALNRFRSAADYQQGVNRRNAQALADYKNEIGRLVKKGLSFEIITEEVGNFTKENSEASSEMRAVARVLAQEAQKRWLGALRSHATAIRASHSPLDPPKPGNLKADTYLQKVEETEQENAKRAGVLKALDEILSPPTPDDGWIDEDD